jgi:Flp pilus assembly protein TadG
MKRTLLFKRNQPGGAPAQSAAPGLRRSSRREKGQAIIELALILPVLLLLTLGIIDFGRAAYYYIEVSDATKAAAQYGSQSMADAENTNNITQAAQNSARDIAAGLGVTVAPLQCGCPGAAAGGCPAAGCTYPIVYLTVNTTYTFTPMFSYPGVPASFNMAGNVTTPVQTQ